MKWIMPLILISAAFYVFSLQQANMQKIENEFRAKVTEVKNHKFDVPDVPEKNNDLSISAAEIKKFRRQINSPELMLSEEAMSRLWEAQDETIEPSLNKILNAKYSSCFYVDCKKIALRKMSAVNVISRDRSRLALKMLLNASKDKNSKVRFAAVKALGDYMMEEVLDPLQTAMSDKDSEVSSAAGKSFEKIINGMKDWRKEQIDRLVQDYSKQIAVGDYKDAERKLRKIVREIEQSS